MITTTRSEQLDDSPQPHQHRSGSKRQRPQTLQEEDFVLTWETTSVALVTFQSTDCSIVLEGCGTIEKLEESLDQSGNDAPRRMHLQGYTLRKGHCLTFDSPAWASRWTTLSCCQQGDTVRLVSRQPTDESEVGNNKSALPSFRVHHLLHDCTETIHPTVYPTSWTLAVGEITQDIQRRFPIRSQDGQEAASAGVVDVSDQPPVNCAFFNSDSEGSDVDADTDIGDADKTNTSRRKVVIAFCGAKNVGKSTCLQFCCNQLLSTCADGVETERTKVAVLDADPGQPLFCLPGQLQMSVVSSPTDLTQNNHATCLERHFFGSTTSETDPPTYLKCIGHLMDVFQDDKSADVLLVNMDGWIKGLGMQILTTVLQTILQPDHVVCLVGDTTAKSLEVSHTLPSTTIIHSCRAYGTEQHEVQQERGFNGEVVVSDNRDASFDVQRRSSGTSSALLRSIRIVSYFLGESLATNWLGHSVHFTLTGWSDPDCSIAHYLASVQPLMVGFDDIHVRLCDTSVVLSEDKVWTALNGSVVGLCRGGPVTSNPNASYSSPCLLSCVGLGLVRSVDTAARIMLIIVPSSARLDADVNVLAVGSGIRLPVECYYRGVRSATFPFLAMDDHNGYDVLGGETMKSRQGIGRRGLGGR